jgi:glucose-1-phosphate thymidylyltransferase
MRQPLEKAVVLAAGLGTRMQEPRPAAILDREQTEMARRGLKAMIPIAGRPFLDHVLSSLADAGYLRVCLVIGQAQSLLQTHYTSTAPPTRISVAFAMQAAPRGTADAVLAAETFVDGDDFLMINSDNYYPVPVLAALRSLGEPGLVAFDRHGLLEGSNITAERLNTYAAVFVGSDGYLEAIIEKPDIDMRASPANLFISMNCWRFSPVIFPSCRAISESPRGELELANAVQYAMRVFHERFRAVPMTAPVLDLSNRSDVAAVSAILENPHYKLKSSTRNES